MIEPNWLSDDPPDSKLLPAVTKAREILSGWSGNRVKETAPFVYDYFTKKFESDLVEAMSPIAVSHPQFGDDYLNFKQLISVLILKEAFSGNPLVALNAKRLLDKFEAREAEWAQSDYEDLLKIYMNESLPLIQQSKKANKVLKDGSYKSVKIRQDKANEDRKVIKSEATRLIQEGKKPVNIASLIRKSHKFSNDKIYSALHSHPDGHWTHKK